MIRGSRGIEEAILKHLGVKRNGQCSMEVFPIILLAFLIVLIILLDERINKIALIILSLKHVLILVHDLFMYAEVTKDGLFSVGEMECMVSHFSYIY